MAKGEKVEAEEYAMYTARQTDLAIRPVGMRVNTDKNEDSAVDRLVLVYR
jgi:hypothetical protein